MAQVLFGEKDVAFDYKRTGRACFFGAFLLGPLAHCHFNFLEWLVVRKVGICHGRVGMDRCGFMRFWNRRQATPTTNSARLKG
jgi:hypothetical protein